MAIRRSLSIASASSNLSNGIGLVYSVDSLRVGTGCKHYFLGSPRLGEAAGFFAATRRVVPVVRQSEGLTITLSDSVTPLSTSDCVPKSRPNVEVPELHNAIIVDYSDLKTFAAEYEGIVR